MDSFEKNSSRIAKNTIILYIRMLITLLVSLYTSRIILAALGVEDYGLYNVVGGIITVLGFLNGTLSTASSRYITVALGKGEMDNMKIVFSSVFLVNVFLSLAIVLLGETIGLWFLYNKMVIPDGRMTAAFWVYQVSIVTIVINIISVPYSATIIAHERMKAFAYISLFDAFAKLGIAFLLTCNIHFDKLIAFSVLILAIQVFNRIVYSQYCLRNFPETKLQRKFDKALLKEMSKFITWSSYGSLVSVGCTQGLNILLNLFFGAFVNAARAVSVQVQSAIMLFAVNFQVAVNPQITKTFTRSEYNETRKLLTASSKFSFFLICLLGIPVIVNAEYIMSLWLKEVPEHAVSFVQIMIVTCMFQTLANPIRIVNQAEGNIRKFQIWECSYLALIIPLSYIALKLGMQPESVFLIQLFIEVTAQFIRIYIVLPKIKMDISAYVKSIYLRIIPTLVIPLFVPLYIKSFFKEGFVSFVLLSFIAEILAIITIYTIGLKRSEKVWLYAKLKNGIRKRSN